MAHDFPSHAGGRISRRRIREAGAIVRDRQECFASREIEHDLDSCGGSVANGILDGFLSDAEEVGGGLRLEIHNRAEGFQGAINLVECAGVFGQLAQRPGEVAIL